MNESNEVIALPELNIVREVQYSKEKLTAMQIFKFNFLGIVGEVRHWGFRKSKYKNPFIGFNETWNVYGYIYLPEEEVENHKCFEKYGAYPQILKEQEVTFFDHINNIPGQNILGYKVGWDYQHLNNTAQNTDILIAISDVIKEIKAWKDE